MACSREGVYFLCFVVGLTVAAIYTAKNALILLASFLVILVVASILLGRNNVRKVLVQRRLNDELFAQQEAHITLVAQNVGHRARYAIQLFEDFERDRTIGPIYVSCLRPDSTASCDYDCVFQHRGTVRFRQIQVRSRFPMPFFEFRAVYPLEARNTVYPERLSERDLIQFEADATRSHATSLHRQPRMQELQFGHQTGRILWKLSARRGEFIEELQRPGRAVCAETIRFVPKSELTVADFEKQISQITDYALKALESGKQISISTNQRVISSNRHDILEFLANA